MGIPKIDITFKELTSSALRRSGRGRVTLLLEDASSGAAVVQTLASPDDMAPGQWTEDHTRYIRMAFQGGAAAVLAVRVPPLDNGWNYGAALALIRELRWNWLAAPQAGGADVQAVVTWIKAARQAGKTFKAVAAHAVEPDSAGVVNFVASGLISRAGTADGTPVATTAGAYTAYLAGILAGKPLQTSLTGHALADLAAADMPEDPAGAIADGKLVVLYHGAGYEIARGVTSLTSSAAPRVFRKIKHVEGADLIADDMADIFRSLYRGRRVNSYENKQCLVGDLMGYLAGLTGTVLSPDYDHRVAVDVDAQRAWLSAQGIAADTMGEQEVLHANTGEEVFLKADIMLADAMEDFSMEIELV